MSKKILKPRAAALSVALFAAFALYGGGVAAPAQEGGLKKGIVCMSVAFPEDLYDKAGDRTVVKFNPVLVKEIPPSREIGVFADFSYPGHNFAKPSALTLGFVHAALGETLNSDFSSNHGLTLTIGGEQIPLGDTSYNKKEETTLRGKVQIETMSLEVQSAVFTRIVNASSVGVKLGQTEFTLDEGQLNALRKIAKRAQLIN